MENELFLLMPRRVDAERPHRAKPALLVLDQETGLQQLLDHGSDAVGFDLGELFDLMSSEWPWLHPHDGGHPLHERW